MSAHTPGPWKLEGWSAGDSRGWSVTIPGQQARIDVTEWSEESEANANLLAVAPVMYEALLEIAHGLAGPDEDFVQFIDRIARAAIAKAEGKP